MEYRVEFRLSGKRYYSEWFETLAEALEFVESAEQSGGRILIMRIENSNHESV